MDREITMITFSYPPESGAAAKRISSIANYLKDHDWKVHIVTNAPHYPQDEIYDGYGRKRIDRRVENDIEIIRIRPLSLNRKNLIVRFISEFYFSVVASLLSLRHKSQMIYGTTPYLFVGITGLVASRLGRKKFVLEVRDILWKYASAAGKRTFGMEQILEWVMLFSGRHSDLLITTTEGQMEYFYRHQSRPKEYLVLPNGVSNMTLEKAAEKKAMHANYHNNGTTRVLYAGTIGFPQALEVLLESAKILPDVEFYIVGDGVQRSGLEERAERENISNLMFTGYVNSDQLFEHYAKADILVAHLRKNPIFEITQPSKVWEYMANGKPIIYGGAGEAAKAVRESDAGIVVSPDEPEELANAIMYFVNNNNLAREKGDNGFLYVRKNYRRERILEALWERLSSL